MSLTITDNSISLEMMMVINKNTNKEVIENQEMTLEEEVVLDIMMISM